MVNPYAHDLRSYHASQYGTQSTAALEAMERGTAAVPAAYAPAAQPKPQLQDGASSPAHLLREAGANRGEVADGLPHDPVGQFVFGIDHPLHGYTYAGRVTEGRLDDPHGTLVDRYGLRQACAWAHNKCMRQDIARHLQQTAPLKPYRGYPGLPQAALATRPTAIKVTATAPQTGLQAPASPISPSRLAPPLPPYQPGRICGGYAPMVSAVVGATLVTGFGIFVLVRGGPQRFLAPVMPDNSPGERTGAALGILVATTLAAGVGIYALAAAIGCCIRRSQRPRPLAT